LINAGWWLRNSDEDARASLRTARASMAGLLDWKADPIEGRDARGARAAVLRTGNVPSSRALLRTPARRPGLPRGVLRSADRTITIRLRHLPESCVGPVRHVPISEES